jgi:hypothetical protein
MIRSFEQVFGKLEPGLGTDALQYKRFNTEGGIFDEETCLSSFLRIQFTSLYLNTNSNTINKSSGILNAFVYVFHIRYTSPSFIVTQTLRVPLDPLSTERILTFTILSYG